jgi:iron complex outermembrane recepter protein
MPVSTVPNASRQWLATALGIALSSTLAAAPGTDSDDRHSTIQLEAVEVKSSPLGGTTEDLSEPVSVLSGETLDDRRGATLGETLSSLPGVQSSNFGPGVGRPVIRGLDGARIALLSGGLSTQDVSTVSQDHAPTIEPFLADQIEVLKGPATLLFGSGAIGGAVNMVDGRIPEIAPEAALTGRAEVRYDGASNGDTEMLRVDGGNERFAVHADAVRRRLNDYDLPGGGQQANSFLDTNTGGLGASLLGDWGFVGISAARYENRYGNPGEPGDPMEGEPGVSLDMTQNRYEFKGGIESPFTGISNLRFSLADTDYEHTEFEGSEVGTRFLKTATEGRLELVHDPIAEWRGAIGLQLSRGEFEAIGDEAFVPKTDTRGLGVFLVEQRRWDRMQLDLGARLDRVKSDPVGGFERSFSPFSLSAGAIFNLNETWDLVANLDHAERAPAEEELFADGPHAATSSYEIGDANLTEEAANQLELGLHFHSDIVEAKVSAYYNRFNDFIYLVDTGDVFDPEGDDLPIRQWTQSDARFRGFEGEATFQLAENDTGNWALRVFGDTVRATLVDGGDVPRIAPARVGSELQWKHEGWRASLGAVRYARQDKVAENETATPGYTLINASAAYHWDVNTIGWEVFVDARNLTDQEARVHTSFLKDSVQLPGRGFGLGLRAFF